MVLFARESHHARSDGGHRTAIGDWWYYVSFCCLQAALGVSNSHHDGGRGST